MQQNLTLQDTTLGGDANKLRRIEELVEEDEVGAKFKIVVEDSSQGTASVEIVLHVRDLFNMN